MGMIATNRFIQSFMMNNKFLVLLPGRYQIIRNGMEHFAVDFGLDHDGLATFMRF
jgi:hypothetical protein